MIQQQQPPISSSANPSPFYREYIATELSSLISDSTVQIDTTNNQSLSSMFKSKLDLNWPSASKVIQDVNTFYYVQFDQPTISIYNILPEPRKYNLILNGATPLAVHVSSKIAYVILLGGRFLTFQLGSKEIQSQYIRQLQGVGCVYSIQTIFNQDKKQSLRIAYESNGLKFYEFNSSFSFLSSLVGSLRSNNNFIHIIPVAPNNLIGFVITNENQFKPFNLYTKQLMDCEPINLDANINIHLLNLRFATKIPSLRKRGYISFFMTLFETNGSYFKLFKVQLKLNTEQIQVDKDLDLDDFIQGNIGNLMTVKNILVMRQQKQIQDIVMNQEGLYVCYKSHHNSPILKTNFRKYNSILTSHPIQMIESEVFKQYKDDIKFNDTEDLRNRVISRFNLPFLNNNSLLSNELYSKLMAMSANDTKALLNRFTTARWPAAYKFISIINIQGILFVVRQQSISMLVKNPYGLEEFQKEYYLKQVNPFEINIEYQQQKQKSQSRLSVASSIKKSSAQQTPSPIEHLDYVIILSKLQRYSNPNQSQTILYNKLIQSLRALVNYTSRYNEIIYQNNLNLPNELIRNVVLSQVRHSIRVLTTLLIRLYPNSLNDRTVNDKNLIMTLFTINKAINSPFKLYQSYFISANFDQEFLIYDALTMLVINQGNQVNTSFSFASFEDHDYLKILGLLFGNDLEVNKDVVNNDNLIAFNRSNDFLKLVVKLAQKNPTLKYYTQILTNSKPKFITEYQLKANLLVDNLENFTRKTLALAILPEFSCKFLKGLFEGDVVYRKGRAILEYLNSIIEEGRLSSSNLEKYIPSDYKTIVQSLLGKCEKVETIQGMKDQLQFLDNLNPRLRLSQFLQKKKLFEITDNIRELRDPQKLSFYLLEVFRKQCQLFNILRENRIEAKYVRQLLQKMYTNLRQSVQNYQIHNNLTNQPYEQSQKILLNNFEPFVYGRLPTYSLLHIVQTASKLFEQQKVIQFQKIPYYYIKDILRGPREQIPGSIRKLLNYFTQDAVIKAVVSNTSSSTILKQKQTMQSVGGYGALNYYQMMDNSRLFKNVLDIIKKQSKQFRSLQKEMNAI